MSSIAFLGSTEPGQNHGQPSVTAPSRARIASRGVGILLVLLALAWLPGQTRANALRLWLAAGVVPWILLTRGASIYWRHLLPWGVLLGLTLAALAEVPNARAGAAVWLHQLTWVVGLALGLGATDSDKGQGLVPWMTAAGVAASVPGLITPGGTFGNPDFLAAFLVVTAIWSVDGLRRSTGWRKALVIAALAIQCAALAVCESLGAWLGVGLGLGAWGVVAAWRRAPRRRQKVGVAVIAALALMGIGASAAHPEVGAHLRGRLYLAKISFDVALQAAPWGVGPGQLHGAFLDGQAERLSRHPRDRDLWTNAYHAHAEPLHMLAEQGLAGVVLLLWPLLAVLLRPRTGPAWAAVVGLGTVGLFSLPLYVPGVGCLMGVCIGAAWSGAAHADERSEDQNQYGRRLTRSIAVAVSTGALLLATSNLLGDRLLARAQRAQSAPLAGWAGVFTLEPTWSHQTEALLRLETDPDGAAQIATEAVAQDPSVALWLLIGRAALISGAPAGAIAPLRETVRLNSRLFAGHFHLARAYEQVGDRAMARRHATRARGLRPSDPRLHWLAR